MAEPFVFHFTPGPSGHPEVMYMADLDCACERCGHEQFQRFYHSTRFHCLTIPDLDDLADRAPLKAGYACENCAAAVGANQVRRVAITYGFADDAGLIRIVDHLGTAQRRYEITAHRRLDPQAIPRWTADPGADDADRHALDDLDEEVVEDLLDRPFNVKLAWRDLIEDWLDDPEGGAFTRVSPGLWLVIDADEEAAADLTEEIDDADFWEAYDDGDLAVISLHDSLPAGLPTHPDPARLAGRWSTWLPAQAIDAVRRESIWADAYISRQAVIDIIARAFDVGRLTYKLHQSDADLFFNEITTPAQTTYHRPLPLSSILRRAVYTGLTPGEAARLTAEELIGELLALW